jgi:hypothetical protein
MWRNITASHEINLRRTVFSRESRAMDYLVGPALTNDEPNALFAVAWQEHAWRNFTPVLNRSVALITSSALSRCFQPSSLRLYPRVNGRGMND